MQKLIAGQDAISLDDNRAQIPFAFQIHSLAGGGYQAKKSIEFKALKGSAQAAHLQ